MKKGKLKKILATSAMGIMALAMPFALTGCDKDSDINVRVEGEYIQWQVEGEDSWTNLLTIDEIKDLLGESYKGDTGAKGEQGNPGINGKEVEFRNNGEYIQWRYVDSNQNQDYNWENLIEVSSLKGNPGDDGEDSSFAKYTITYDYVYSNMTNLYDNYKTTSTIKSTEWITSMPIPKDTVSGEFDGWYIKGTDKKIENYDFVGGDATLEARWKVLPSGIYSSTKNKKYINNWDYLVDNYFDISNGVLKCSSNFDYYLRTLNNSQNGDLLLIIDNSITEIADNGFCYEISSTRHPCYSLREVFIPESVTKIGRWAFLGSGLTNIIIPDSVTEIGAGAFSRCEDLQKVVLPNRLNKLSQSMFDGDSSLMEITLPNSLTTIEDAVFYDCISLNKIIVPASVTNIGEMVFSGCIGLEHLSVESGNTTYHSLSNNSIIETNTKTLLYGCSKYIPSGNSVNKIGDYAYYRNSQLEEIFVWENIEEIGSMSFYGCNKLKTIILSSVSIANSFTSENSHGYLLAYADTIYVDEDLIVDNSTYILENFTKQADSDGHGHYIYVRNTPQL